MSAPSDRPPYLRQVLNARLWRPLLLAAACALALALLAVSNRQAQLGQQALQNSRNHAAVLAHMDQLLVLLVDAETGVRGYLLARQPVYLEPYLNASRMLAPTLAELRRELSVYPEELAALDGMEVMVRKKQDLLKNALDAQAVGPEIRQGQVGPGKIVMDQLRAELSRMRERASQRGALELAASEEKFERLRWAALAFAASQGLLLLILFAVLQEQLRLRERLGDLLQSENERLAGLVAQRTQELSDLASYLTDAREAEREHVARELHDELGALLTAAKMEAGWVARKLPADTDPALKNRLAHLLQVLNDGIALKRRMLDDLRPPLLQGMGLVASLRALTDDFRRVEEIAVQAELPAEDVEFEPDLALAVFRIAQEALTNVRKYAQAGRVEIHLVAAPDSVELIVQDDGGGFDPAHEPPGRHGLAGMKHRVQMFQGRFTLVSAPGQGTRISAVFPRPAAMAPAT